MGVLLPIPLVLLLGLLLRPEVSHPAPGSRPVSPVLSAQERMRLTTYGQSCGTHSECEPPLGCLLEARAYRQYCTDSRCITDSECPEGQVCQSLATAGDGPLVRFCVPLGVRQEGESCLELPREKEAACARGLVCGGRDGWCARPCHKDAPADCPVGFFCADTRPQPVCLPSCETQGCPAGQDCIRFGEGTSVCAQVYGTQCQQSLCPEGRKCEVRIEPTLPGKVWMECVERCGEGFGPCAEGMICDGWQCKPSCNPQDPTSCGDGYSCKQRRPDKPYACQPDG